jgi:toxin FitB
MIVLDTNVVSELMRPHPDGHVQAWYDRHDGIPLLICAITEAELWAGFHRLPEGQRRAAIGAGIADMLAKDFSGHILPFDSASAKVYGLISGMRKCLGKPISTADAQIAAVAQVHGFKLATRNIPDFEKCGVDLINPWMEA